ncbi:Uu.00g140110.m01.CDS01 [Anthostomella pinea]|uniref:Uu.00g140110.m01.CDS01 n=1 Tax=Anthostomella pinea TaxID=933095 RepID=A0AAI8VQ33_9PEZI|nr:Uu.00g140110.m01.CDS01 [Anthostomella pinea]
MRHANHPALYRGIPPVIDCSAWNNGLSPALIISRCSAMIVGARWQKWLTSQQTLLTAAFDMSASATGVHHRPLIKHVQSLFNAGRGPGLSLAGCPNIAHTSASTADMLPVVDPRFNCLPGLGRLFQPRTIGMALKLA